MLRGFRGLLRLLRLLRLRLLRLLRTRGDLPFSELGAKLNLSFAWVGGVGHVDVNVLSYF